VTFFFPFYVKTFLGGNEFQIGLMFGLSMLAVGFAVPVIGAWSDEVGKRMPFIIVFTIICCIFTWLTAGVTLMWALIAGFLANFSYHAALTTYNALLPRLGNNDEIGNISGIGTAMGYLGTLISLAIAAPILAYLGWETQEGARAIFAATAVMFFVFSLPTFFGIKEKRAKMNTSIVRSIKNVGKTVRNAWKHKHFVYLMGSMFCFTDAINAVIIFLFLFAKDRIHLGVKAFFFVYAVQSLGATAGSFIAGRAGDRFGQKKVLTVAGVTWIAVIVLLMFVQNYTIFLVAGVLGGAALGAVWTAQRPKMLELVADKDVGQFFGFLELTNKFSGVFGPIIFGALAHAVSYFAALASLVVFFVAGLFLLRKVPGD